MRILNKWYPDFKDLTNIGKVLLVVDIVIDFVLYNLITILDVTLNKLDEIFDFFIPRLYKEKQYENKE